MLASSLDVDFVLSSLLLTSMSKLLVPRGMILLDDPLLALEGGEFRVEAAKGRFHLDGVERGTRIRFRCPSDTVEGDAVPEPLRRHGIELVIPVIYHERTIGVLALGPKATGGLYSEDERAFLNSLVHMSATAVHNAWMVEELKQANRELGQKVQQLNTLFDLAQGFTAAPDVEKSAHMLALTLMGQFMVRRFAVLLRSGGTETSLELAASREAPDLTSEMLQHLEDLRRLQLFDEECPPEFEVLRERGFALALPLRMQDLTRGVLLLGPKLTRKPYDAEEVEFLSALGQLALTAIENARGLAARLDKERLEDELRLARSIQERLLPHDLPRIEGLDVAALNLASRYVAGDYYEALRLDKDRLLIAVADVSGKGLPASLLMANLQACLHIIAASVANGTVDLPTATSRINRVVHRNTGITTFITFFWGILDRRDGTFAYVNAGHNPPVLTRRSGKMELLEEGGVLLGVIADAPYAEGLVTLDPGDCLALYTDGVTEAWAASNPDDEFGEERLNTLLREHVDQSAAATLESLRGALKEHTGGGALDDDLTVIIVRRDD